MRLRTLSVCIPFTVSNIIIRRLGECDRIKVPLRYYIPSGVSSTYKADYTQLMYIFATGIIYGVVTIGDAVGEQYKLYEKMKKIKEAGYLERLV